MEERVALRPSFPEEVRPSVATDRREEVGLRTRSEEVSLLYRLSYVPKDDGTRTRNPCLLKKEPQPAQQADIEISRNVTTAEASKLVWLRDQGSNLELLLQRQAWCRFHHLALAWSCCVGLDGEIRTPNLRSPTPARFRCATSRCSCGGTDGGIRTHTFGVLSAAPLPVGLRQQVVLCGPRGIRTRTLLLARETRFQLRHRPRCSCVGREGGNRTRGQGV